MCLTKDKSVKAPTVDKDGYMQAYKIVLKGKNCYTNIFFSAANTVYK